MSGWLTNGMSLATLPLTGTEEFPVDTQKAAGALPETEAVSLSQLAKYTGTGAQPWVAGRFYGFPPSTTPVAVTPTASTLYAYPLYIPAVTVASLQLNVTTPQTGGNAHVGIYSDNGAGYPGALIYDSGNFGSLAATAVVINTPTTTLSLNSGLYWIASSFTATSTLASVSGITSAYTNPLFAELGSDTAVHLFAVSGQAPTGISVATTYGALPSTFTAGATLNLNTNTAAVGISV